MIPVTLFGGPLDGLKIELSDALFELGAIRVPMTQDPETILAPDDEPIEPIGLVGKVAIYVGMDACGYTGADGVPEILHARFKFDSVA